MRIKLALFSVVAVLAFGMLSARADVVMSDYNSLEKVSSVFSNKEVLLKLKSILGPDYDTFSQNFDVYGEPHLTSAGGLFVEGWLRDLYLEQASAVVIQPDGRTYAAWTDANTGKISYRCNDNTEKNLQSDIAAWAKRFNSDPAGDSAGNLQVNCTSKPLSASDFSVEINHYRVSLGDEWDNLTKQHAGVPIAESYAGDRPSEAGNYHYYQYKYPGFDIYSSNLNWEKEHRDSDSYIIAQITLNSPGIKTYRGVSVGDSESALQRRYGKGAVDDSDDQYWIYYEGDGKRLLFQIEEHRISHIMMVFNDA
ncbi:hypothetical protein [Pantoea dispersa]|uniref:hypothetical protein n=2 Tax=Pantoea TaxID=53335 RepID=UPI001EE70995|nr:hypothetical protein [Pantoea dispersa]UKY37195.1 hypothetical protein KFZ74_03575 [Pantoea dispersa]UYV58100.1 hypothetical protein OH655_03235 [Pantoea dispersa]